MHPTIGYRIDNAVLGDEGRLYYNKGYEVFRKDGPKNPILPSAHGPASQKCSFAPIMSSNATLDIGLLTACA